MIVDEKTIKEENLEEPKSAQKPKFNPKTFKRQLSGGVPRSKAVVNDIPVDKIPTTGAEK